MYPRGTVEIVYSEDCEYASCFLCVYLWLPKIHVELASYAQMSSFGKEVKAAVLCSNSFIQ